MTNQQGVPEALRLADELEDSLESHDGSSLTARCQGIADDAAAELRRLHAENERLAALVEAQQPALSAAAAGVVRWAAGIEGSHIEVRWTDGEPPPVGTKIYTQPSPTPQADSAPAEPAKHDPRKLKLRGLIFALARLTCSPPLAPAVQHQLERLIDFYFEDGDDDFARKLVLLKNGALSNGRRSVLVPSAADAPQADSQPAPDETTAMNRTRDLAEAGRWPSDWVEAYRRGYSDRAASATADSVLEDAARLEQIAEAIRDYHYALDTRKHGGVAESAAFNSICLTMGMQWEQGKEADRRTALAANGGKP